jgi:dTDP-4-dehydrorhamnose reductase
MRVCVTGSNGQVGTEVVELLSAGDHDVHALGSLDVADESLISPAVATAAPDVIIHCAAYTDVDGCETDPARAMRVNRDGVAVVAAAADAVSAFLVTVSTDYVFDGEKPAPYVESDPTNPLCEYGRSKLAGEQLIDQTRHAVVRTSWVCGRVNRNVARTVLGFAAKGTPMKFVDDQRGHPTIARDLARGLALIAEDRRTGIWHMTNQGAVSWYEFARAVVETAGFDPALVSPIATSELDPPRPARRPKNSVLDSERLAPSELLPDFRESLPNLVRALAAAGRP